MNGQTLCFEISACGPEEAQTELNKWLNGFENKPTLTGAEMLTEQWDEHLFTRVKIQYTTSGSPTVDTITRQAKIFSIRGHSEEEINNMFLDAIHKDCDEARNDRFFTRSDSTVRDGSLYAEALFI